MYGIRVILMSRVVIDHPVYYFFIIMFISIIMFIIMFISKVMVYYYKYTMPR